MPDGDRSLGGFVLREQIGSGGFGDIFLAEQSALHREAIVKLLREAGDPSRVESFLREAQLASRLDHPYAAHIYAFGAEPDGTMWIAMERVRGASLREVTDAQGAMPIERFVPLLERICEVVHTAHEQGIIHRDLKPDNVMVISRAGRLLPKLLDFGIARATADEAPASAGGVLGSPPYMAPELWVDAKHAGAPADQYALGALAYEALTGRFAFTGTTMIDVARAHARGKVAPLGDGFPPALDAVIARSLAKKPGDRFGNVLELAQAFRDASGIGSTTIELPQLDEELRVQALANAPQPIADAVAGYDAAKNAHQAREAMRGIVRISAWYVGILALACRTRVGSGASQDSLRARDLLRDLRRQGLTPAGWIALAEELTKPFARLPDTYPIPELALLLHPTPGPHPFAPALQGTLAEALGEVSEEAAIQSIARELPVIASLLRALAFLDDYQVVVPRGPLGEVWMGTRTGPRRSVPLARALPEGQPVVIDAAGMPLLAPWPLLQVQLAVPGHTDQLFLLAGPARATARLMSLPHNFEHRDDTLWDWFRDQLFRDDDEARQGPSEDSPYKGLASYTGRDAAGFFGREREIDIVVNRLKLEPFVAIVGPSGVGKSSFVHAGVAPALEGWQIATTRPGRTPLAHLFGQLAHVGIAIAAEDDPVTRLREATRERGLLIVVDQFEELFTLGASTDERARFVELLLSPTVDDQIRVAITLRDDFLIRAQQLPGLDLALARGLQLVGPLAPAALERIIVEPLRRAGYELDDPQLPARIVEEAGDTPAAIALISFTATRWWELRDRHFHQMPKKAYEAIGGVTGALARHADETVDALPQAERALVRKAFRHLTTSEGTRAVLARAELLALLGGTGDAERVIERLIESRLIVTSEGEGGAVIEIVHEALLGAWPRLVEWRHEDAEGSRFHEQLRAASRQWDARGRARGLLWRGDALAEYQVWRKRHPDGLTPAESAFGDASIADSLRGRRIRRALIATALLVAAVFVVFLWRANSAAQDSERKTAELLRDSTLERGRLLEVQGDKLGALGPLIEAWRMGVRGEGIQLMIEESLRTTRARIRTFEGHTDKIWDVAYSPDGTKLATASADGTARIWDAATGATLATIQLAGPALTIAFSADGKLLAAAGRDTQVHLWNLEESRDVALPVASAVNQVVFSPDGSLLLAAGYDGKTRLWRVGSREVPVDIAGSGMGFGAFTRTGDRLATWDENGTVQLFDAHSLTKIAEFKVEGTTVVGAMDREGTVIAIGDASGRLVLVRPNGKTTTVADAHEQPIQSIAISPDGTKVLTGSADTTARLWDVASGRRLATLVGHRAAIEAALFSPSGTTIATSGADGSIRLWSATTGLSMGELAGHSNFVGVLAFRPDGRVLASGSWDHATSTWDVSAAITMPDVPTVATDIGEPAPRLAYSPDNSRIAFVDPDGGLAIADSAASRETCHAHTPSPISVLAWSPDGRLVATASGADDDRVVRVWTSSDCELVRTIALAQTVYALVFERSGSLVTGGPDKIAREWDVSTGAIVRALPAFDDEIVGLERISDDRIIVNLFGTSASLAIQTMAPSFDRVIATGGKQVFTGSLVGDSLRHRLLAASYDQRVWIFDDRTGQLIGKLEANGPVFQVQSSPDGALIVALGGTVPIAWDANTLERRGELAGHVGIVRQGVFISDRLLVTASRDGTARVWDLSSFRSILTIARCAELARSPDGVLLIDVGGTRRWRPRFDIPSDTQLARFTSRDHSM